eukprot:scaffold267418_cov47-Attheya_sp.AAC.1
MPAVPGDMFAQIKARAANGNGESSTKRAPPAGLMAALQAKQQGGGDTSAPKAKAKLPTVSVTKLPTAVIPEGKLFHFDPEQDSFLVDLSNSTPRLVRDQYGNPETDILVPLAPCVYRMTDYTLAKQEPITLHRCLLKLNVLRCLQRECANLNQLLWHRHQHVDDVVDGSLEEDELGKIRFMELLSNCGVFQKVAELILQRCGQASDAVALANKDTHKDTHNNSNPNATLNPFRIPQVHVQGLDEFLQEIETQAPSLHQARHEIDTTQTVSFYPGLGELFCPGSKLLCFPEGVGELGCSIVQSWYVEEENKATGQTKRRFVLVVEFIVSVGEELVFVAASDVYPEFHDPNRNVPLKDLTHRKLGTGPEDALLLQRLQQRGEFYASVATHNHYLEYRPHSFFPIIGGWSKNAVRPLLKGGRVMVDVKRGILEGHLPVRGTNDGMSDTVKEAIKLFEQSKRTGVAVPFRTCILPGFDANDRSKKMKLKLGEPRDSDRTALWQAWPMLTGFSFTARVWGKLLLGLPKGTTTTPELSFTTTHQPVIDKLRVQSSGLLGGEGSCSNCGYINFQEQAFDQLVLADDKKELIRAVASTNSGSGSKWDRDVDGTDSDDSDDEDIALDVVANKGAASIFLLSGPPGTGKTLTAEAIAELLKKPLYIVTAGDLGTTAAEVEKTLGSVLELCQTWDALVLLDEADIFLEARNNTEIQRNAL